MPNTSEIMIYVRLRMCLFLKSIMGFIHSYYISFIYIVFIFHITYMIWMYKLKWNIKETQIDLRNKYIRKCTYTVISDLSNTWITRVFHKKYGIPWVDITRYNILKVMNLQYNVVLYHVYINKLLAYSLVVEQTQAKDVMCSIINILNRRGKITICICWANSRYIYYT